MADEFSFDFLQQAAQQLDAPDAAPAAEGPGKPAPASVQPAPYDVSDPTRESGFGRALSNNLNAAAKQFATPTFSLGRAQTFDRKLLDTFQAQDNFQADGFDPNDQAGNQARYAARETWGSTMAKTLDDFGHKFQGSFVGNFETYGQMGKAIVNMDLSQLDYSDNEKLKRYQADQENEFKNQIFQTPEENAAFFNKQFVKDMLGNSGFALGTFAAAGVELAADAALEAITFGGATPVVAADAVGLGAKLLGGLRKIGEGVKLGEQSTQQIRQAAELARAADHGLEAAGKLGKLAQVGAAGERTVGQIAERLSLDVSTDSKLTAFMGKVGSAFGEHVPIAGTLAKYASRGLAAAEGGEGILKVLGIGAMGVRRSVTELNMAASEAAFESVTTYGETLDKLTQQYRDTHNGDAPPEDEVLKLRGLASKASAGNYQTNLALLLVSNKIQFGNMFAKFSPANKYVRDLAEETAEQAYTRVTGKLAEASGQVGTRLYEKGFFGGYGTLGKIAADFGKKEALWQAGKTFAKDALRFEVLEGVQENLQETSAAGWRDYYTNAYAGKGTTLSRAMGEGLQEQFTQQGFKTFLMGALTGTIIHGVTSPVGKAIAAGQDKAYQLAGPKGTESPMSLARQQTRDNITTLNAFFKDPGKAVFNPQQLLFNEQVQAASQMTDAARQGKLYEWQDAKENSMLSIAKAARALNAGALLTKTIRESGDQYTPEQFKEAFGIDLKDTKYSDPKQFTREVASDIEGYLDEFDKLKRKMGPYLDASRFGNGATAQAVNRLNATMEQAVSIVALNKLKGGMAAKRAIDRATALAAIPGMADVSERLLNSLGSVEAQEAEAGQLEQAIAQTRQELKDYEKSQANQGNAGITYDAKQHENSQKELDKLLTQQKLLNTWATYFQSDYVDVADDKGQTFRKRTGSRFVGKESEVDESVQNPDGTLTTTKRKQHLLDHPDVADTFQELVTVLSSGNSPFSRGQVKLSQDAVRDGFQQVVDYIRLEQDSKDYQQAIDKLTDPRHFVSQYARMLDGRFKAEVGEYLEILQNLLPHQALARVYGVSAQELLDAAQGGLPTDAVIALNDEGKLEEALDVLRGKNDKVNEFKRLVFAENAVAQLQAVYLGDSFGLEHEGYTLKLRQDIIDIVDKHLTEVFGLPTKEVIAAEPVVTQNPDPAPTPAAPDPAQSVQPTPPAPDPVSAAAQELTVRWAVLLTMRDVFLDRDLDTATDTKYAGELIQQVQPLLGDARLLELQGQVHDELARKENEFGDDGTAYGKWLDEQIKATRQQVEGTNQPDPAPTPTPSPAPRPSAFGRTTQGSAPVDDAATPAAPSAQPAQPTQPAAQPVVVQPTPVAVQGHLLVEGNTYQSYFDPTQPNNSDTPDMAERSRKSLQLAEELAQLRDQLSKGGGDAVQASIMRLEADYGAQSRSLLVAREAAFKQTALYQQVTEALRTMQAYKDHPALSGFDNFDLDVAQDMFTKLLGGKFPGYQFVQNSLKRVQEIGQAVAATPAAAPAKKKSAFANTTQGPVLTVEETADGTGKNVVAPDGAVVGEGVDAEKAAKLLRDQERTNLARDYMGQDAEPGALYAFLTEVDKRLGDQNAKRKASGKPELDVLGKQSLQSIAKSLQKKEAPAPEPEPVSILTTQTPGAAPARFGTFESLGVLSPAELVGFTARLENTWQRFTEKQAAGSTFTTATEMSTPTEEDVLLKLGEIFKCKNNPS